jgi:ribosome biogenesis protein SSF1/2
MYFAAIKRIDSPIYFPLAMCCRGKVPALVRELIKDTRRMMAPFTALKLAERKSNRLKDFVAMSGALGVSHMLCFSTTETVGQSKDCF